MLRRGGTNRAEKSSGTPPLFSAQLVNQLLIQDDNSCNFTSIFPRFCPNVLTSCVTNGTAGREVQRQSWQCSSRGELLGTESLLFRIERCFIWLRWFLKASLRRYFRLVQLWRSSRTHWDPHGGFKPRTLCREV